MLVPDEYAGPVMSGLPGRRGRVVGTGQAGLWRTVVGAEVPELEIGRYAVELRSVSHGTGLSGRSYPRHEPVPPTVADRLCEEERRAGGGGNGGSGGNGQREAPGWRGGPVHARVAKTRQCPDADGMTRLRWGDQALGVRGTRAGQ